MRLLLKYGTYFLGIIFLIQSFSLFPSFSHAQDFPAQEIRSQEKDAERKKWPIVPAAKRMVEEEILPQGDLQNETVLDAVMRIPREKFVLPAYRNMAYWDTALPIGNAQTISPPYIVSYMTEKLDPQPDDKVLEIGTGSGYQAAVLSLLVKDVYSIEIVESLGKRAAQTLKKIGYKNVFTKIGDGYQGWPEAAPFDKIIVTCSPESVPQPLIDQLKNGGLMLIPVGERYQQYFYLLRKKGDELEKEALTPALFVPMTGEAENQRVVQPDPKNPSLIGGDFEQVRENGYPVGWHYARNAKVVDDLAAPQGSKVIRFEISSDFSQFPAAMTPFQFQQYPQHQQAPRQSDDNIRNRTRRGSRGDVEIKSDAELKTAQVIQGFAVDGKYVSKIRIELTARGKNIYPLNRNQQKPNGTILVHFYNDDRDMIQSMELGPAVGSFDWKKFTTEINVPKKTKEANIFLGLFQSAGTLDIDAVSVRKVK